MSWPLPTQRHHCQTIKVFFFICIFDRKWHCQLPCGNKASVHLREILTDISVTDRTYPHSAVPCQVQMHLFHSCTDQVDLKGGAVQKYDNSTLEWLVTPKSQLRRTGWSCVWHCTGSDRFWPPHLLEVYLSRTKRDKVRDMNLSPLC